MDAFHREKNGWAGIGYHFYVRKSGEIVRGRPEDMQGAHTLSFNDVSLGICFEGNFEVEEMGEAQKNAGLSLCRELLDKYPEAQIFYHKDFNNTACPGKSFPYKEFNRLNSEEQAKEEEYENFKIAFSRFEEEKRLSPPARLGTEGI
ncbi:MAG: peptidoglycan recognition protein family protein [Oscillospiraceae bacterium]|nr:peptidoglycan recognition protein family protein [Oscillospiraceae bacterium]